MSGSSRLLFVYKADSGLYDTLADSPRRILLPRQH